MGQPKTIDVQPGQVQFQLERFASIGWSVLTGSAASEARAPGAVVGRSDATQPFVGCLFYVVHRVGGQVGSVGAVQVPGLRHRFSRRPLSMVGALALRARRQRPRASRGTSGQSRPLMNRSPPGQDRGSAPTRPVPARPLQPSAKACRREEEVSSWAVSPPNPDAATALELATRGFERTAAIDRPAQAPYPELTAARD